MPVAHRIYAEALLEAAKEKKTLDQVREEFADFVAALGESDELAGFVRNPQIDPGTKSEALGAVLEGGDEAFRNFVRLLTEKHRIGELEEIHVEWERLLAAEERVLEVELTTAVELSDKDAKALVGKIEQAAGRRVEATRSVDPDLIGGLVLQAGSTRVDGSVRGRLERLRRELISSV
jgi:F-type H+-transporting ATPase subunit delta